MRPNSITDLRKMVVNVISECGLKVSRFLDQYGYEGSELMPLFRAFDAIYDGDAPHLVLHDMMLDLGYSVEDTDKFIDCWINKYEVA